MKKKTIFIGAAILAGAAIMVGTLNHTNLTNGFIGLNAEHHTCSGNHYNHLSPTIGEYGVKEYWVCCECHEIYYSTKYIPNYDPANWVDNGTYTGSEVALDDRGLGKLFDNATVATGGFTATKNENTVTINGTSEAGTYLASDVFYNVEFDVSFSESSTHNPWGNNNYTNALIVGGVNQGTFVSGYYIDVCTSFTTVYEIKPNGEKVGSHSVGTNPYTNPISSFKVKLNNNELTISDMDNNLLIKATSSYYFGGSIGFYNTNGANASITISNVKGDNTPHSLFANATYSEGNTWTVDEDASSFTVTADGYALSHETYTSFKISISMDRFASSKNLFFDHEVLNSLIIGGGINESGYLTGYAVEFHTQFVMIGELNGTNNKAADCIDYIALPAGVTSFDIYVCGTNVTYVAGTTSKTKSMEHYKGGYVGFLANYVATDGVNNVTATILA